MTLSELGGLGLMVALLGLAQRVGKYENKHLARFLDLAAAAVAVAWSFMVLPQGIAWAATGVTWSICLLFIFTWVRGVDPDQGPADTPPAPLQAALSHDDFPITRKKASYDPSPKITYHSKVYVEMMNNTPGCVEVSTPRWVSGIKAEMFATVLQLWLGSGWFPKPEGLPRLHVPPGERFRFWIAPDPQYAKDDLQKRCDDTNLGFVAIRFNGKERSIAL